MGLYNPEPADAAGRDHHPTVRAAVEATCADVASRESYTKIISSTSSITRTEGIIDNQPGGTHHCDDKAPSAADTQTCLHDCVRQRLLDRHKMKIKWFTLYFFLIFRICSYSGDFGLDLYLIVDYYQNKCWGYFILTLVFVFLPAIVISYLNWKYYNEKWKVRQEIIDDTNNELRLREKLVVDPPWKFYLRRFLCLSLFSPIAR